MILKMKLLPVVILLCMLYTIRGEAETEQQVRLEDIEHDNLLNERQKHKDIIVAQQTQHIKAPSILAPHHFQQSFEDGPQDIFVTPPPDVVYAEKGNQQSFYHLPKVHEADRTHPAASRQSLISPNIGGHYPIANYLNPQPQYVYVQANQQPVSSFYQQPVQQHYIPQAQPYVMMPFASHYGQQYHHHQLPPQSHAPPSVFSFGPSSAPQTYPLKSSVEYAEAPPVAPLQTSVEYAPKNVPQIQYDVKKPHPTTSFQQYYSPGVEYHYTETVPNTKLTPQAPYHYETPHHYQQQHSLQPIQHSLQPQSYSNHQQPFLNYYQPSGFKHHDTGLLDSYVPSLVTFARQQQLKNLFQPNNIHHSIQPHSIQPHSIQPYSTQPHSTQQNIQHSYPQLPNTLRYQPYPSAPAYNTIAYSVKLPPYDHSKRSIAKATAVKT